LLKFAKRIFNYKLNLFKTKDMWNRWRKLCISSGRASKHLLYYYWHQSLVL